MTPPIRHPSAVTPVSTPHLDGEEHGSPSAYVRPSENVNLLPVSGGNITKFHAPRDTAFLTKFLPHIKDVLNSHTDRIMERIEHLNAKVDGMMVLVDHKNGGGTLVKGPATSPIEYKLDALTPHVNFVFSIQRISDVLRRVVFVFPSKMMENASDFTQTAADALQVLLFSIHPQDTKAVYDTECGKNFAKLRRTMVSSLICNAQSNRFDVFKRQHVNTQTDEEDDCEEASPNGQNLAPENPSTAVRSPGDRSPAAQRSTSSSGRRSQQSHQGNDDAHHNGTIIQPKWLKKGFMSPSHVTEAAEIVECGGRSYKMKKSPGRGTRVPGQSTMPSSDEIAVHGALRLFRLVTTTFHSARENMKVTFFEELGYLLLPWNLHGVTIDQSSLLFTWLDNGNSSISYRDVPLCHMKDAHAKKKNAVLARNFLKNHKHLILNVRHDVRIRKGGPNSKAVSGVPKQLKRSVHLVFVATRMLASFAGAGDVTRLEDILSFDENSMKCCYGLALALRDVVNICKDTLVDDIALAEKDAYDPASNNTLGLSLQSLLPTPTNQERLLTKRCLLMTVAQFNHINVPVLQQPSLHLDDNDTDDGVSVRSDGAPAVDFDEEEVILV